MLLGVGLLRPGGIELAPAPGWSLRPQPYHPYHPTSLIPALAALLLFGLPIALIARREPLGRAPALVAVGLCGALCLALQFTLDLGDGPTGWFQNAVSATWSRLSNGYFEAAYRLTDPLSYLREYREIQAADTMKLSTHPPGAVLGYWLALRLWDALPFLHGPAESLARSLAGGSLLATLDVLRAPPYVPRDFGPSAVLPALWCVFCIAVVGASVVLPTYLLAAADGQHRRGVLAAALVSLAPSTLFYYLSIDGVLMTLLAWTTVALVAAVRSPTRIWPAAAAGALLGVSLLISLGSAAGGLVALLYVALAARDGALSRREAVAVLAALAVGTVAVLLAISLAGLQTWPVLRACLAAHESGPGGTGHRPYLPWVLVNPLDYLLLLGLPLAAVAIEGALRGDLGEPSLVRLSRAALLGLVLLDLSGTVKGETERLWMFFNPWLAASAAAAAVGRSERFWPLLCQPLQLLLMALALPPLVRPF